MFKSKFKSDFEYKMKKYEMMLLKVSGKQIKICLHNRSMSKSIILNAPSYINDGFKDKQSS